MILLSNIVGFFTKNPMLLIIMAVAGWITFQNFQVDRLKGENADLKEEVAQLAIDSEAVKKNLEAISIIQEEMAKTRSTQTVIRERIINVPVKAEDRPFVDDPGLLDRAGVMRDHQRQNPPVD